MSFFFFLTENISPNFLNSNLASAIRKKRENSELDNVNDPFSSVETYNDDMCRKRPFRIRFSDIGLGDWMLPTEGESVDIGVCKGSCTVRYAPVVSQNAKLRRLAYEFNLTSEKEAPCCAPLILEPLKIKIRYDNGSVLPSSLSDVVISQCGCH